MGSLAEIPAKSSKWYPPEIEISNGQKFRIFSRGLVSTKLPFPGFARETPHFERHQLRKHSIDWRIFPPRFPGHWIRTTRYPLRWDSRSSLPLERGILGKKSSKYYEVVKENKWGVGQMGKLNHKTNKRLSILKDKWCPCLIISNIFKKNIPTFFKPLNGARSFQLFRVQF